MTTIKDIIRRGCVHNFKRCSVERLQTTAQYEDDWLDISPYVISYPSIKKSFGDNVYLGDYQIDGGDLVLNNTGQRFSDESNFNSIFYGFLSRYRTKIKIECGFYDDDMSEIQGAVFYGIVYSEPTLSDNATISLSVAPLIKVLQNYTAYGITTSSGTTGAIIDRILKKQVNGMRVLDRFFEGSTDAEKYQINPSGATLTNVPNANIKLDSTMWDKIKNYSLIDDFFAYVNSAGNFVWDSKWEKTNVWTFNGPGALDNDYGCNIISLDSEKSGVNNVWTRIVITYNLAGSQVQASDFWTPGDGGYQDIYGERIFSYEITDLDSTKAQSMADTLLNAYKAPKKEWAITTPFIPHLELKDIVTLNYVGNYSSSNAFIMDSSVLDGTDVLSGTLGSVFVENVATKIVGIELDINNLKSKFILKEI